MHSVLVTRSLAFELIFQSLSSMIVKPEARCVAFLRSEGVDPALRPNRCLTIGSKKMSPANCVSKEVVGGGYVTDAQNVVLYAFRRFPVW